MGHPIDSARRHFTDFGTQSLEVPEWGEDGKPLVIYYSPLTLAEKQRLLELGEREGYVARMADVLIMKALTSDGKKMFTLDHKRALRHQVDPEVLSRIAAQLTASPTVADLGKDSSRTETSP